MTSGALRALERAIPRLHWHFPFFGVQVTTRCWLNAVPVVFIWLRTRVPADNANIVYSRGILLTFIRDRGSFSRMQTANIRGYASACILSCHLKVLKSATSYSLRRYSLRIFQREISNASELLVGIITTDTTSVKESD